MLTDDAPQPPAILAAEAEAGRGLRMGIGFGKLGGLFGLLFAGFFLGIGHYWGALVVIVCTAGFAANLLVLKRGRLALAGNLYALLMTAGFTLLTAIEGGLAGHAIAWLACVPMCACLFSGPRAGKWWCLACLAAIGAFSVFSCLGYTLPTLYPADWTTLVSAAGYLALTLFMSNVGLLFETSRQRAFRELRLTLEELAGKNLALFRSMGELRRSEARFRMLFENSALGVALLDERGRVQLGNARLAVLLGVPVSRDLDIARLVSEKERAAFIEMLGRQARSRCAPSPEVSVAEGASAPEAAPAAGSDAADSSAVRASVHAHDHAAAPDGDEFILELPGRGKRIFRFFLHCIPDSSQVCAMLDDVTAQRALERAMVQQEKSALLDTLIGGIAHELNNKLTPVAGFADLMLSQAARGEASPDLAAQCAIVRNGAMEAGKIIAQLLQLSRPLAVEMEACDLRAIVETVCAVLTFRLRETGSRLALELPPREVLVSADAGQLKQVVLNLALNALDAMAGQPARRLRLGVREEGGDALLTVADTGCGMSAEVQARIFDPFFTTKGNHGTGLGLSVCAGIVRSHGGVIEVESEPGAGSRFTMRLPLSLRAPANEAAGSPDRRTDQPLPETSVPRGARALVVEDEESIGEVVREILREHFGSEAAYVGSVEEAIGLLEAGDFDFVVSDLRLPGLTGLDLWTWLRKHRPGLARRVVIATGDAGSPELSAELNRSDVPVLHKPFTSGELIAAVTQVWQAAPAPANGASGELPPAISRRIARVPADARNPRC